MSLIDHTRPPGVPMSTANVVAVFSRLGGTGRTTLALALATAAQNEGRSVVIVDADRHGDAARYVAHEGLDLTVVDLSESDIETRMSEIALLTSGYDLVIVDTPVGFFENLADRMAGDGAYMLGVCGLSAVDVSGLFSRISDFSDAGVPRARIGYVLNRVPPGLYDQVEGVREALTDRAGFHGLVLQSRTPLSSFAPVASNVLARLRLDGRPARGSRVPA